MPVPAPTSIWVKPDAGHMVRLDAFDHILVVQAGATWSIVGYVGVDPRSADPEYGNPARRTILKAGFASQALAEAALATIATNAGALPL